MLIVNAAAIAITNYDYTSNSMYVCDGGVTWKLNKQMHFL